MWNKLTGKSDTASSQAGDRDRKKDRDDEKDKDREKEKRRSKSGGSRRAESVISTASTSRRDREDEREKRKKTLSSRTSSFPGPESVASSGTYATALSSRERERERDREQRGERERERERERTPKRSATVPGMADDAVSTFSYDNVHSWDRPRDDESTYGIEDPTPSSVTRRSERERERERTAERERESDSPRDREERRAERRARREAERESNSAATATTPRKRDTDRKASRSIVEESTRARPGDAMPGAFPDQQYSTPSNSGPLRPQAQYSTSDPHLAHQFPGMEGGGVSPFGAAADYYGDQGQSVAFQPGIRPDTPLINAQPHLQAASAQAAPAQDTGNGSAADYFAAGGTAAAIGAVASGTTSGSNSKPSKPSKQPSGSSSKPSKPSGSGSGKLSSAAAAAAVGAGVGYAMNSQAHESASSLYVHGAQETSSNYQQAIAGPSSQGGNGHSHSLSAPSQGTYGVGGDSDVSPRVSPSHSPSRPGKSNFGKYAAGAAAAGAAAYTLHNHGHNHSTSSAPAGYSNGAAPGIYNGYDYQQSGPYNGHSHSHSHNHSHATGMRMQQRRGPMGKLADWWKDHEDVMKMEEYTEYIGVCRGCFDPNTSVHDAPRKHHYRGVGMKRKSNDSLRERRSGGELRQRRSGEFVSAGGGIRKDSRYYSYGSDEEKRRKATSRSGSNKAGWVAAGLGAYGLAKAGKAVMGEKGDFDDTYSVRSGKRDSKSYNRHGSRSRSNSRDRRSSYGVIRRRGSSSSSPSSDGRRRRRSGGVDVVKEGRGEYRLERKRSDRKKREHSRSSSRDRKSNIGKYAAGAALAGSAVYAARRKGSRSRSRSNSPRRSEKNYAYVRKHNSHGGRDDVSVYSQHGASSRHRGSNVSREDLVTGAATGGILGSIFGGSGSEKRRRTSPRRKRKTGFFTFGNGSSSSDLGLAYGDSRRSNRSSRTSLDAKGKKPKRKSSDEKINATLLGIGATAAALAAAQQHGGKRHSRTGSDIYAVKEKKGRHAGHGYSASRGALVSRPTAHSSDDDDDDEGVWEDDPNDSSGFEDEGLAYGDWRARKSTESLASNASGTGKWFWRWGGKKNKRRRSGESLNNNAAGIAAGAAAGAVAANMLGRAESMPGSVGSLSDQPSLQNMYPVMSGSDPTRYDAAGVGVGTRNEGLPLYSSRPETLPLNQPQPHAPINGAVYTSGVGYGTTPAYAPPPSGPSVFAESPASLARRESRDGKKQRPVSYSAAELASRRQSARVADDELPPSLPSRKRRDSSPLRGSSSSNLGKNVLIGTAAAAAGVAAASALSGSGSNKTGPGTPSKDVRFSFDAEQAPRERDRDFRHKRDEEDDRRRAAIAAAEEEERRKRVEAEERDRARAREEARRREEEEQARARWRAEEERALAARREADRQAEAEREAARRASLAREADERERREREAERHRRERDRADKEAAEREAAAQAAVALEREAREAAEREAVARERAYRAEQDRREVERQEREAADREFERRENERRANSWGSAVAAGAAGIAAASAISALSDSKKDKKRAEDVPVDSRYEVYRSEDEPVMSGARVAEPKTVEPRVAAPAIREIVPKAIIDSKVEIDDGFDDDVIFDPDYFKKARDKKRAAKEMALAGKAADKVIADMQKHYDEGPVNNEEFWAPAELKDHSHDRKLNDPNADADVKVVHDAHPDHPDFGVTISKPPYESEYAFTPVREVDGRALWAVPQLKLIEPTPPPSRANSMAGSVRGSVPPSPVVEPQRKEDEPVGAELQRSRSGSRVRWGEDQTHIYDAVTPESIREKFISDDDVTPPQQPRQSSDEIVVEERTRDGETKTSSYKPAMAASAAAAAAYGISKELVESPVEEELPRVSPFGEPVKDDQPVYRSTSPEREARVVEPDERRNRRSGFYGAPSAAFYDSVSDIATGVNLNDDAEEFPSREHGYVEGEVFDPTPKEEKDFSSGMPGGFIEDEEPAPAPASSSSSKKKSKKEKRRESKELQRRQSEEQSREADESSRKAPEQPSGSPLPQFMADAPSGFPMATGIVEKQDRDIKAAEEAAEDKALFGESTVDEDAPFTSTSSKKSKKQKKKEAKRKSRDLVEEVPEIERDIRDIEPPTSSASNTEAGIAAGAGFAGIAAAALAREQEAKEIRDDYEKQKSSSKPAAEVNVFDFLDKSDDKKPREEKRSSEVDEIFQPLYDDRSSTRHEDEPASRYEESARHEDKPASRYEESPSRYNDQTPSRRQEPSSRYDEPVSRYDDTLYSRYEEPERNGTSDKSDKRSSVSFADAVSYAEYEDPEKRSSRSVDDSGYISRYQSVPDISEEPTVAADDVSDADTTRSRRKKKRSSRHEEDMEASITSLGSKGSRSDEYYDDDKKSRRRSRNEDDIDSPHRYAASEAGDDDKKSRRRSKHEDDVDSSRRSYAASEVGDDEGRRRKHRSKRDSDIRDDVSVASTSKLYDDERSERRRRSKRDSDIRDDVSVASTSRLHDDEKRRSKDKDKKEEKKGGLFGMFSSSKDKDKDKDDKKSRSSRDDEDREHRHRKKRSSRSNAGSTFGSDDEDEDRRRLSKSDSHSSRNDDDSRSEKRRSRSAKDDYSIASDDIPYSRYSRQPPDDIVEEVHSHNEDAESTTSSRRNKKDRDSKDQSFLGDRAEDERAIDAAPLPARALGDDVPSSEPSHALPDLTVQAASPDLSREIGAWQEGLPSLPASRPTSPVDVGHSQDLPSLPDSRPGSPYEEAPRTPPRPSLESLRAASKTAVPFRFRRPNIASSPIVAREVRLPSPATTASPSTPYTPSLTPKTRHSKSLSGDHTKEYRPLYLVEKTRKTPDVEDNLPPLPDSASTSRTPSVNETDDESSMSFHSAVQSPEASFHGSFDEPGPIFEDRDLSHEPEDLLDSQQTTPKAATFPVGVMDIPAQPGFDEQALFPADPEETPKKSREPSPSGLRGGELAAGAALGVGAGLVAHKFLSSHDEDDRRSEGSFKARDLDDFMGGEASEGEDEEFKRQVEEAARIKAEKEAEEKRPVLSRKTTPKRGKKGKRGSKTSFDETPDVPAPTDNEIKARDAQDAVDSWFEATPSAKGKGKNFDDYIPNEPQEDHAYRVDKIIEDDGMDDASTLVASEVTHRGPWPPEDIKEQVAEVSKVSDVLLQRTPSKKAKKKGKKSKGGSISLDKSELPVTEEAEETSETTSAFERGLSRGLSMHSEGHDTTDLHEGRDEPASSAVNVFDFMDASGEPEDRLEPVDDKALTDTKASDDKAEALAPELEAKALVTRDHELPAHEPTQSEIDKQDGSSIRELDTKPDAPTSANVLDFLDPSATPDQEKSVLLPSTEEPGLPPYGTEVPLPLSRQDTQEKQVAPEAIHEQTQSRDVPSEGAEASNAQSENEEFTLSRKKSKGKKGKKGQKVDLWGVVAAGVAGAAAGEVTQAVNKDEPAIAEDATRENLSEDVERSVTDAQPEVDANSGFNEDDDKLLFGDDTPLAQAVETTLPGETKDDDWGVSSQAQAAEQGEEIVATGDFTEDKPQTVTEEAGVRSRDVGFEAEPEAEFQAISRSGSKKKKKGKKGKNVDVWADEPSRDLEPEPVARDGESAVDLTSAHDNAEQATAREADQPMAEPSGDHAMVEGPTKPAGNSALPDLTAEADSEAEFAPVTSSKKKKDKKKKGKKTDLWADEPAEESSTSFHDAIESGLVPEKQVEGDLKISDTNAALQDLDDVAALDTTIPETAHETAISSTDQDLDMVAIADQPTSTPVQESSFEPVLTGKKKKGKKNRKSQQVDLWADEPIEEPGASRSEPHDASQELQATSDEPQATEPELTAKEDDSTTEPVVSVGTLTDEKTDLAMPDVGGADREPGIEAIAEDDFQPATIGSKKKDKKKRKSRAIATAWDDPVEPAVEQPVSESAPDGVDEASTEADLSGFSTPKKVKGKGKKRQQKSMDWEPTPVMADAERGSEGQLDDVVPSGATFDRDAAVENAEKTQKTSTNLPSVLLKEAGPEDDELHRPATPATNEAEPRELQASDVSMESMPSNIALPTVPDDDLVEPQNAPSDPIGDKSGDAAEVDIAAGTDHHDSKPDFDALSQARNITATASSVIDTSEAKDVEMLQPRGVLNLPPVEPDDSTIVQSEYGVSPQATIEHALAVSSELDLEHIGQDPEQVGIRDQAEGVPTSLASEQSTSTGHETHFHAAIEGGAEDEWAVPVKKSNKKKGKKSGQATPVLFDPEAAQEAILPSGDVETVDELSSLPILRESTSISQTSDPLLEASAKQSRPASNLENVVLDAVMADASPVTNSQEDASAETLQTSEAQSSSRGLDDSVDVAAEDAWTMPVKNNKKGKKGKKSGQSTFMAWDEPKEEPLAPDRMSTEINDDTEPASVPVEVVSEKGIDRFEDVNEEASKDLANVPDQQKSAAHPMEDVREEAVEASPEPVSALPEVADEDEGAMPVKKSKKAKKGRKSGTASPDVEEPSLSEDHEPSPQLADRSQVDEAILHEPAVIDAPSEKTGQEAEAMLIETNAEDEWAIPVKKGKKSKKGNKSSSSAPFIEEPAFAEERPTPSQSLDEAQVQQSSPSDLDMPGASSGMPTERQDAQADEAIAEDEWAVPVKKGKKTKKGKKSGTASPTIEEPVVADEPMADVVREISEHRLEDYQAQPAVETAAETFEGQLESVGESSDAKADQAVAEDEWAMPAKKSEKGKRAKNPIDFSPAKEESAVADEPMSDVFHDAAELQSEQPPAQSDVQEDSLEVAPQPEPSAVESHAVIDEAVAEDEWAVPVKKGKKGKKGKKSGTVTPMPIEESSVVDSAHVTEDKILETPLDSETTDPFGSAQGLQEPSQQEEATIATSEPAAEEDEWALPAKKSKKKGKKGKQLDVGSASVEKEDVTMPRDADLATADVAPQQDISTGTSSELITSINSDHDNMETVPKNDPTATTEVAADDEWAMSTFKKGKKKGKKAKHLDEDAEQGQPATSFVDDAAASAPTAREPAANLGVDEPAIAAPKEDAAPVIATDLPVAAQEVVDEDEWAPISKKDKKKNKKGKKADLESSSISPEQADMPVGDADTSHNVPIEENVAEDVYIDAPAEQSVEESILSATVEKATENEPSVFTEVADEDEWAVPVKKGKKKGKKGKQPGTMTPALEPEQSGDRSLDQPSSQLDISPAIDAAVTEPTQSEHADAVQTTSEPIAVATEVEADDDWGLPISKKSKKKGKKGKQSSTSDAFEVPQDDVEMKDVPESSTNEQLDVQQSLDEAPMETDNSRPATSGIMDVEYPAPVDLPEPTITPLDEHTSGKPQNDQSADVDAHDENNPSGPAAGPDPQAMTFEKDSGSVERETPAAAVLSTHDPHMDDEMEGVQSNEATQEAVPVQEEDEWSMPSKKGKKGKKKNRASYAEAPMASTSVTALEEPSTEESRRLLAETTEHVPLDSVEAAQDSQPADTKTEVNDVTDWASSQIVKKGKKGKKGKKSRDSSRPATPPLETEAAQSANQDAVHDVVCETEEASTEAEMPQIVDTGDHTHDFIEGDTPEVASILEHPTASQPEGGAMTGKIEPATSEMELPAMSRGIDTEGPFDKASAESGDVTAPELYSSAQTQEMEPATEDHRPEDQENDDVDFWGTASKSKKKGKKGKRASTAVETILELPAETSAPIEAQEEDEWGFAGKKKGKKNKKTKVEEAAESTVVSEVTHGNEEHSPEIAASEQIAGASFEPTERSIDATPTNIDVAHEEHQEADPMAQTQEPDEVMQGFESSEAVQDTREDYSWAPTKKGKKAKKGKKSGTQTPIRNSDAVMIDAVPDTTTTVDASPIRDRRASTSTAAEIAAMLKDDGVPAAVQEPFSAEEPVPQTGSQDLKMPATSNETDAEEAKSQDASFNAGNMEQEVTEPALEDDFGSFAKVSKKEKRKGKKAKKNVEESIIGKEEASTSVSMSIDQAQTQDVADNNPDITPAEPQDDVANQPRTAEETVEIFDRDIAQPEESAQTPVEANIEDEFALPVKKKDKKKKGMKNVFAFEGEDFKANELPGVADSVPEAFSGDVVEPNREVTDPPVIEPEPMVEPAEFFTKKSKKEKRKAKKGKTFDLDDEPAEKDVTIPGPSEDIVSQEVQVNEPKSPQLDEQLTHDIAATHEFDSVKAAEPLEGTSSRSVDFAASVAAGLTQSGFDSDIVMKDAALAEETTRSTALDEPEFDELPLQAQEASRRSSRRNSRRRSRAPSVDAASRAAMEESSDAKPPLIDHQEFAAILAAGLSGSGFNPDIVQDDQSYAKKRSASPKSLAEEEIEGFSEKHKQTARGRKARRARSNSPSSAIENAATTTETQAAQKTTEDLPLPAGWFPTTDATTGKTYYYTAAGEVQWQRPAPSVVETAKPAVTEPKSDPIVENESKPDVRSQRSLDEVQMTKQIPEAVIEAPVTQTIESSKVEQLPAEQQEDEWAMPAKKSKKKGKNGGKIAAAAAALASGAEIAAASTPENQTVERSVNVQPESSKDHMAAEPTIPIERQLSSNARSPSPSAQAGRLAGLFPGLERVKRKVPPRQESLAEHQPTKKQETGSGAEAIVRITSPRPSVDLSRDIDMQDAPSTLGEPHLDAHEQEVKKQPSAQDLAQPTWSFPSNRDSAAVFPDSPASPNVQHQEPSAHTETVRDSGYHDTPVLPQTPAARDFSGGSHDHEVRSTGSSRRGRRTSHGSSKSPIQVRVEVSPEWNVAVSQGSPEERMSRRATNDSLPRPFEEMRDEREYPFPDTRSLSPPAVESTSKDRSSNILFQSSPSTRERPVPTIERVMDEPFDQPDFEPDTKRKKFRSRSIQHDESIDSPKRSSKELSRRALSEAVVSPTEKQTPISTPMTHARNSSAGLHTIMETSPASPDSPLVRKTRHPTLHHESASRSLRRSQTPEKLKISPRQDLHIDTSASPKRVRSTGGMLSRSERSEERSTHSPDTSREMYGIDSTPHGDPSKRVRSAEYTRTPGSARDSSDKISPFGAARPGSAVSNRPTSGIGHRGLDNFRPHSPNISRPLSAMSTTSVRSDRSLRRTDRSVSGDLRGEAKRQEANVGAKISDFAPQLVAGAAGVALASTLIKGKDKSRGVGMEGEFEGYGRAPDSPMSPTRPPSVRKRQSMQIMDLQTRVDQIVTENKSLQEAKQRAEQALQEATQQRDGHASTIQQAHAAVASRDVALQEKDGQIAQLSAALASVQAEIARVTQENTELSSHANSRAISLETENTHAHAQWQTTARELEDLRAKHQHLNEGIQDIVAGALVDKDAEIQRLQQELAAKVEEIKELQQQLLGGSQSEDFLNVRNEDYFDSACQQLCQHVQQWVLRFSKFSDNKLCRLSSDISDEKLRDRLDDAILDGSDVDVLLADRIKRRDVFMSVVMSMVWEYVFTRYLFGMDRDQRKKLKTLEETLTQVGPQRAVAQWRAITLTLLSRRETFISQRKQDTEAVVQEIYANLSKLLPPPSGLVQQIQDSLRKVLTLAVDLAIEMRTQRAEYIMLPPLKPEYDTNGDLIQKVQFNAALMNERSGEFSSNEDLEDRGATVKLVLYPLVVKKGDETGEGDDEIVVCPAQVLVAKPANPNKKVVRVMSGAMEIDNPRESHVSYAPTDSNMF